MEISDKISSDIYQSLAYIGADPSDFALANSMFSRPKYSPMHGIGHIFRTMIGCALLGKMLQKPREGLLAFCGAYIHDLGRVHDGRDPRHGANAANRHFSKFNHLWDKYQLTDKERIYVRWAVEQHCCRQWIQRGEEGYDVMAILKDADALDRCRFRTNNLRPEWLLYNDSKLLIKILEKICSKTQLVNEDITFNDFISLITKTITNFTAYRFQKRWAVLLLFNPQICYKVCCPRYCPQS